MTIPRAATGAAPLTPPVEHVVHRPIIVATDGTEESDAALDAARLLAPELGAPVRVVSVVAPEPYVVPSPLQVEVPPIPVGELLAERREALREEMRRVVTGAAGWAVDVRAGPVALELADAVREADAQLVVTGLRHHGPIHRVLRGETPLGVLNEAHVPTLIVPSALHELPRNVLVAVSVGDTSVDAAAFARPLVASASAVFLVHVQPPLDIVPAMTSRDFDDPYLAAVERAFDRVAAALELPSTVHVERKVFIGNVADELLDFADFAKVDLIVVGHRRRPLIERLLSGGTARRLFHGATTWLLVVPEDSRLRQRLATSGPEEETNRWLRDRATWPDFLDEFARRNAGRPVDLELHDHLGAQTIVSGYPLLGIDAALGGRTIDVMLGDPAGTEKHLRHTVRFPTGIAVYRAPDGRDAALRITDRFGAILIELAP